MGNIIQYDLEKVFEKLLNIAKNKVLDDGMFATSIYLLNYVKDNYEEIYLNNQMVKEKFDQSIIYLSSVYGIAGEKYDKTPQVYYQKITQLKQNLINALERSQAN